MKKSTLCGIVAFAAIAICATRPSYGRTWYVEKNGMGDFVVIQNAVDAARSGDIIRIGPGRYSDYTVVEGWGPLGYCNMYIWLDGTKSLAFIGAGDEETIIGPDVYASGYTDIGIACDDGNVSISVEHIKIENQNFRGAVFYCESASVASCIVERCYAGMRFDDSVNEVSIVDSMFINGLLTSTNFAISCAAPNVLIEHVEVNSWVAGINLDRPGSLDTLVRDCTFNGGDIGLVGMQYTFLGGGIVENCYFTNLVNYAFVAGDAGTVIFRNNIIEYCPGTGIGFEGCEDFAVYGNIVRQCVPCIFIGEPCGVQSVYDNVFLRDESVAGRYIRTTGYYPFGPYYMDFTNNYWGTTDPAEVSEWIYDGYDDPDVWLYVVFEPMADNPLDVTPNARAYGLLPPYPNPFNPETTIRFRLAEAGDIDLAIYDVKGALVTTLVSGSYAAGPHEVVWRGLDRFGNSMPSGVYLARLVAGDVVQTERLVLVR